MMPRAEGMSGFYDRTLPGTLRDLARKLGGEGRQSEVAFAPGRSVTATHLDITPQMRAQAVERGFPLFLRAPTPRIGAPGLANVAGAVAGGAAGYAAGDE